MRRWPVAVAVSVAAHVVVGALVWAALSATPAPTTRPVPLTKPLEVLRVGALLPRPGGSAPGAGAPEASGSNGRAARLPVERVAETRRPAADDDASRARTPGDEPEVVPVIQDGPIGLDGADAGGVAAPDARAGDGAGGAGDLPSGSTASGEPGGAGPMSAGHKGEGLAGAGGDDLDAVTRRVHARLAAAARDCYPAAARRFRQLGRVPVRFCVGANLSAERLELSPSGLALLDDAARECVVPRAAPFPAEAATRCFEVAVDFGP